MTLRVEFALTAEQDLRSIHDWIADTETAVAYLRRIRTHCDQLADFPNRGTPHNHLVKGMRAIGFERKATIVYLVELDRVRIMRVLHKGQDIDRNFGR